MHTSARHRDARPAGRHRAVDDPHRGLSPAFRIDAGSTTTSTAAHSTATYARYVGRIGALAVALGVGAALATCAGAGMARADDGSDSSSSTGVTSDASSAPTSAGDSPATSTPTEGTDGTQQTSTAQSGSAAGSSAPRPTVPDMNVSHSGGADTSDKASTPVAAESDATDNEVGSVDAQPTTAAGPPTVVVSLDEVPAAPLPNLEPQGAVRQGDSPVKHRAAAEPPRVGRQDSQVAAGSRVDTAAAHAESEAAGTPAEKSPTTLSVTAEAAPIAEALEPEAPELSSAAPSIAATVLAAVIAPFALPGPATPVQSPLLWAVLAWTRRESVESVETVDAKTVDAMAARGIEAPESLSAVDVEIVIAEDTSHTGALSASNPDGNPVSFDLASPPEHGVAIVNGDGTYEYQPDRNFNGVDAFTVTVTGGAEYTTATVIVTVTAVVDAPEANDDYVATPVDTPLTINVLANDWHPDGDPLTVALNTPPRAGTLSTNADGTFTYTPKGGYSGGDEFTYTVTDPSGAISLGTVRIAVGDNKSPVAPQQDVYSMTRDTTLRVDAPGVLANDEDSDGDPLTVVSFGTPGHGKLAWASDGSFTYTPDSGYLGSDEFTYVLSDPDGATAVGHVLVIIDKPPNQPPRVVDHVLVTEEGIDVGLDPIAGLEDPDGDPLVARVGEQPLHGFAQQTTDGTIFYVPDRGFVGTDSYTYTVFDGYQTVEAKVTITVGPSTRPTAVADEVGVAEGGKVTIDVLKNDVSPRGDELKVELIGGPSYGKVEYDAKTRTFVYTAMEGANRAVDDFLYEVTDKDGRTSMATVTIHIKLADAGPQARDDWASTPVNTAVVVDVLDNDVTPGEKPPLVRIDTQPRTGKAVVLKDGTISYTPEKDFTGTVELGYSVTDSQGGVSRATVTITVYDGGQNANDKWYTVAKDRTLTVSVADGVLSGPEQEGWSAGVEVKPRNGTLAFNEDGSFTYTPNKGFVGQDAFAFYVHTSEWGDGPYTVTIDVTEVSAEPDAEANYGTAIALESSSAFGTCGDNLMPGQGAPADVWPTCLFTTAVRRPSDPW